MNVWRFIESPPADIFRQMALDRELFDEFVRESTLPPLLRIFRVSEPGITVGRSWQEIPRHPEGRRPEGSKSEILRFAQDDEKVCVRPTGGGLVRHGDDLIYSVLARRDSFPTFGMVRTSYLSFHEAVQAAFQVLGRTTRLFRCDEARDRHCETANRTRSKQSRGLLRRPNGLLAMTDCFKEPVATDVLLEEEKIAGGGQWRRREGFIHQGSIQIPRGMTYEDLRDALKRTFAKKFGINW